MNDSSIPQTEKPELIISEWHGTPEQLNEALTRCAAALSYCQLELIPSFNPDSTIIVNRDHLLEIVLDVIKVLDSIEHTYEQYSNAVDRYIVSHQEVANHD